MSRGTAGVRVVVLVRWAALVAAVLLVGVAVVRGQKLTLEACHELIDSGYPLTRQEALIRGAAEDHRQSLLLSYAPQISIGGKATYQSDVPHVELDMSKLPFAVDMSIPEPRRDQYQLYADVVQVVWDGGGKRAQSRIVQAESNVGVQQVRVQLEQLHGQVDELYFTILLIDRRLSVYSLLDSALARQHRRVSSYVANGVASAADVSLVEVEQHRAAQGRIELEAARESAVRSLEALIGAPVAGRELVEPEVPEWLGKTVGTYSSPEMDMLGAQVRLAEENARAVNVKLYPTVYLFFRGGWGNPGLNMLEDEFRWYYYAGVQFAWNFGSFYDYKQVQRASRLRKESYEISSASLARELQSRGEAQRVQLLKYDKILAEDSKIIALLESIASTKEAQVENGTATVLELLEAIRESQMAVQDRAVHEVERLRSAYKLLRMLSREGAQ